MLIEIIKRFWLVSSNLFSAQFVSLRELVTSSCPEAIT